MKEQKIFRDNIEGSEDSILKSATLNDNLTETKNLVTNNGLALNENVKNQMSQAVNLEAKSIWYSIDPETSDANILRLKKHLGQEVFQLPHYRNGISLIFQALKDNVKNNVTLAIDNLEAVRVFFIDLSTRQYKRPYRGDIKLGYTNIAKYIEDIDGEGAGFYCQLVAHNENGNNVVTDAKITTILERVIEKINFNRPEVGTVVGALYNLRLKNYLRIDGREYLQTDYPDLYDKMTGEAPRRRGVFNILDFRGLGLRARDFDHRTGIDGLPSNNYDIKDRPYGHVQMDKLKAHVHSTQILGNPNVPAPDGNKRVLLGDAHSLGYAQPTKGISPLIQGYDSPTLSPQALLDYGLDETRGKTAAVDWHICYGRYQGNYDLNH